MKNHIASLFFAMFCLLSFFVPVTVRADGEDTFFEILNQRMPDLLAKYKVPGAVISYIEDGEVTWTQAFGLANIASGEPMSTEMIFNFGSTGKVLTGWGVMRLVEQGKVDLDTPVNRYLKRWQIQSSQFDPNQVTLRRLLSHTAGLTASGFTDYSPRRILPSLVQMLEGHNQLDGRVILFQNPGEGFKYSGGGYVLLQMVIEDVTGEPFDQFMEREVTLPLSMPSLHWSWTPELVSGAPVSYGTQQEPLEYRKLASQAIGSEVGTVSDYARFVAAAVSGPENEPAGRGVLRPETITEMTTIQPGTINEGLAYGVTVQGNGKLLQHFGANTGWTAFFSIDTALRQGLVMANNSGNGFPLNAAVQNLWRAYLENRESTAFEPDPAPSRIPLAGVIMLALAGLLALSLMITVTFFTMDLRVGKRSWSRRVNFAGISAATIWVLVTAFWIYWFYTTLPLPFPPAFPDFWRTPQSDIVTGVFFSWMVYRVIAAFFPKSANQTTKVG